MTQLRTGHLWGGGKSLRLDREKWSKALGTDNVILRRVGDSLMVESSQYTIYTFVSVLHLCYICVIMKMEEYASGSRI